MRLVNKLYPILVISFALSACTGMRPPQHASDVATATAAIAMPDVYSADVAEQVLLSGGNAIDATVAAALVLAVTYPEAGNIGGGGFMLIRTRDGASFLDYRETAPAAATRDMYLDEKGVVIPDASLVGHLAVGVPGTIAGLWAAHRRYGTQPWQSLVAPAVRLARDGFVMSAHLATRIRDERIVFENRSNFDTYFSQATAGVLFRQPELADTLERIAVAGAAGFYSGRTADLIVAEAGRGGGLLTQDDLSSYKPIWRTPLSAAWRDYTILSAPPPSMGGFGVIQLLKMKEFLASDFRGLSHNSVQYIHLVAEMEKRVFADRAEYFGDPDFVDVPIKELIDPAYLRHRASQVNRNAVSTVASSPPGLEARHTTHFSIIDRNGKAVSNTYTLNSWFGSGVVVEGGGFLLNNEMDDFSAKPGVPNFYGVVGGSANAIEPGKRMLSSMSPTILLDNDGEVAMVVGTPGGSTIFTSVFQTIVNIVDFGMDPATAVEVSRFHHQLLPPDLITYSRGWPLPQSVINELNTRGYRAEAHPWEFGDVQVVWRDGGEFKTGSDPRGRGTSRSVLHSK